MSCEPVSVTTPAISIECQRAPLPAAAVAAEEEEGTQQQAWLQQRPLPSLLLPSLLLLLPFPPTHA